MKPCRDFAVCKYPWPGVIEAYRAHLPVTRETPIVTLLEGNTPLVPCVSLAKHAGIAADIYLKYEGLNPTGSFKDRGMTLAISKAIEEKSVAVLCASTGNTSASASAYAARCGLRSIVLIPSGAIALGKLSQALIHGARVAAVEGNFDTCLTLAKQLAKTFPITLVNSVNPHRIEGQKSCAFEMCDVLGRAPDFNVTPVGNAGNITAQWKGYQEYHRQKKVRNLPVMLGFQAAGAAPIVIGKIVKQPKTVATAIKIGNPASWQGAIRAREESKGCIDAVTDREILAAYQFLAQKEGVFVEPASAASVAGLIKYGKAGFFARKKPFSGKKLVIVCVVTGHGLKDPERAIKSLKVPKPVPASLTAIIKAVRLTSR